MNVDYSKCTERGEVEALIMNEMKARGIKPKPASPKSRPPAPLKLSLDIENQSPKTSNMKPRDQSPPRSSPQAPRVEASDMSDWNNLSVTPQGRKKKKKKKKKVVIKPSGASEHEDSPTRSVNSASSPTHAAPTAASSLPPLLKNKHAKIDILEDAPSPSSSSSPQISAAAPSDDKPSMQRLVTNSFMDAAAARYKISNKGVGSAADDADLSIEEQLGMKEINGTELDEDVQKAYRTNRFMPAKKAKTSEDNFDHSASYVTDEDARLGRHFHRRRKTDKYGWWNETEASGNVTRLKGTNERDGALGNKLTSLKHDQVLVESRSGFLLRTKAPTETDAAIKFYSDQLRKFDRYDFPEEWATCHATMAKVGCRICIVAINCLPPLICDV